MDRREFMKGAALGVGAGVLGSMGLYSYSPLRRAFLPEVKRGTADIGVCKSVKVTNISETSWFDNGIFMNDVTGAGRAARDSTPSTGRPSATARAWARGRSRRASSGSSTSCRTRSTRRGPSPRKTASMPTTRRLLLPRRDREHGRRDNPLPVRYRVELRLDGHVLQARGHRRHACPTTRSTPSSRPMSTWTTTGASPWSPSTIPTSTSTRPTPSTRRARNT